MEGTCLPDSPAPLKLDEARATKHAWKWRQGAAGLESGSRLVQHRGQACLGQEMTWAILRGQVRTADLYVLPSPAFSSGPRTFALGQADSTWGHSRNHCQAWYEGMEESSQGREEGWPCPWDASD